MRKLLITIACSASLLLAGCSLGRFPWVYRIDIPQGNIVTQRMVNQLNPGMTKRQVRFIMGTPLIQDTFHQDRWDYVYRNQTPAGKVTERKVSVFFDSDGKLARITGTLHPQPNAKPEQQREQMVEVPKETRKPVGLFETIGSWFH